MHVHFSATLIDITATYVEMAESSVSFSNMQYRRNDLGSL